MTKQQAFEEKWKKAFKPLGRAGAAAGNSIAIEVNGVIYDTLTEASKATGKSFVWLKKHGKLLK